MEIDQHHNGGMPVKEPLSSSTRSDIKKLRAQEAIRRNRMKKLIWIIVVLAVLGGIVLASVKYSAYRSRVVPGEVYADDGQEHVSLTYEFTYSSNPPSSGPHYGTPAKWDI